MNIAFEVAKMLGSLVGSLLDVIATHGKLFSIFFCSCLFLSVVAFAFLSTEVAQAVTALIFLMGLGGFGGVYFKRWIDADSASV